VNYFWNTFDQALIRPSLLRRFSDEHFVVVTRIGDMSLLDEGGIPNREVASDHLPITVAIDETVEEVA
jgi:hypothetical protein